MYFVCQWSYTPGMPKVAPAWTFLSNHSHVLTSLIQSPNLTLREVAEQVGITERAVQRIVRDLEEAGALQRERVGRQNRYVVTGEVPLRHPLESHRRLQDLLDLFKP